MLTDLKGTCGAIYNYKDSWNNDKNSLEKLNK